jgi:long-chain acyl-CoA synthetase
MGLRDFTLFDIVERNARLHPNRLAFLLGDERVSHAAYRARAERLGAGLARAGVRPGDRVGVVSQNNLEFIDLYGAVARLGAILVPVNWRLSADEVAYVVADAAPKIVIADAANQPLLQAAHSSLPMVERWYGIGTNSGPFAPYADLLGGADHGARRRRTPTPTLVSS